ncbi:hypothetical protein HWV62_29120 [Athelia sp. TMB]|nr:hypothetical protein HWV62_29120 [Athelia sp. TMB]
MAANSTARAAAPRASGSAPVKAIMPPAGRGRDRPPRDTSKMTCYSCSKMGHISSEPACENYDANCYEVEDNAEPEGPTGPEEADGHNAGGEHAPSSWGGSQYKSEGDEYEREGSGEEHETQPHVAAMYTVRLAAMRTVEESTQPDDEDAYLGMPPLMDCSNDEEGDGSEDGSEDESGPLLPNRVLSDRGELQLPCPLRTRFIADLTRAPDLVMSSLTIGNRFSALNHQRSTMGGSGAIAAERAMEREWGRRSIRDWDNGPHIDGSSIPARLWLPAPHIHRSPGRDMDPIDHLPTYGTSMALSSSVWMDTQECILEFAEREHLDEYNRFISVLVVCWCCGHRCCPTVFQRLARLPLGPHPATYLTTYVCHFAGRPEGRATIGVAAGASSDSNEATSDDEDTDSERGTGGDEYYGDGSSYVDNGDEYYGALGEYSSSLYTMRQEHSANIHRPVLVAGTIARPQHNQNTISCLVTINGHEVLALFDSGSTTDSITPEFGFTSRTWQFKLDEQITLQLGCIGSRSKIVYGAVAPVLVVGISEEMYFDVVNIDKYDTILGTPFLQRHGILLDFKRGGVIANDTFFRSFSLSEEIAFLAQKRGGKEDKARNRAAAATRALQTNPNARN